MPRLPLHPSSGIGGDGPFQKTIRLVRYGCANRPFYHIVVTRTKSRQHYPPIEQLGTYDPLPNKYNEKLVALNLERIQYWMGQNAAVSKPMAQLLGLVGFLPLHPITYMQAWRNRRAAAEKEASEAEEMQESEANANS